MVTALTLLVILLIAPFAGYAGWQQGKKFANGKSVGGTTLPSRVPHIYDDFPWLWPSGSKK